MLKYKNYTGIVEYDPDGKVFTGEVIGLRDVVTFQGRTPEELEQSFRASVDFYLEMCQATRLPAPRPGSGAPTSVSTPRFTARLPTSGATASQPEPVGVGAVSLRDESDPLVPGRKSTSARSALTDRFDQPAQERHCQQHGAGNGQRRLGGGQANRQEDEPEGQDAWGLEDEQHASRSVSGATV